MALWNRSSGSGFKLPTAALVEDCRGERCRKRHRFRCQVGTGKTERSSLVGVDWLDRLGLTVGDVASRYDITVTAKWELIETATGKSLKKGRTSSVVTFGAPSGPYGVITADNVGVEQAAKETADKLVVEIAKLYARKKSRSKK